MRGPSSVRFTSVALVETFGATSSPVSRWVAFVCQFAAAFLAVNRSLQAPPLNFGLFKMPLSGIEKFRNMPSSAIVLLSGVVRCFFHGGVDGCEISNTTHRLFPNTSARDRHVDIFTDFLRHSQLWAENGDLFTPQLLTCRDKRFATTLKRGSYGL